MDLSLEKNNKSQITNLKGHFIKIQTIAHIVIGGHRLRIVVHHDCPVPQFTKGSEALHCTPVEFHWWSYSIDTRACGGENRIREKIQIF